MNLKTASDDDDDGSGGTARALDSNGGTEHIFHLMRFDCFFFFFFNIIKDVAAQKCETW